MSQDHNGRKSGENMENSVEKDVLLGEKTTSDKYRFIAELRNNTEKVVLCEGDYIELYRQIMGYFDSGKNIKRFYIEKDNEIMEEKVLDNIKILRKGGTR